MNTSSEHTRERVRHTLEQELERVDTPEAAEDVVRRLEGLAAEETEEAAGEEAEQTTASAAEAVEHAAERASGRQEAAAVLAETAAQAVAPTPEAEEVVEGLREAVGTAATAPPPAVRRGRDLLRHAILRRMGPLDGVDARIFLAVNGGTRPLWMDRAAHALAVFTNGGWFWILGALVAHACRVRKAGLGLRELLPAVTAATWLVEHPIKSYFRRRRPFIDVIRATVVGKKPGSWSFPSGHTASAFAGAWVCSTVWPRGAPIFFTIASTVGFSRVYVGAHYPGDVLVGALFGGTLAEVFRRVTLFVLDRVRDD